MLYKRNELRILLSIIPAISLLTGCGGNTFTVKTKDGSTVEATTSGLGTFPQDFPLPQYPGSKVIIVTNTKGSGTGELKKGVMLSSSDTPLKIANFYKEQLQSGGWTVDSSTEADKMVVITATRGDIHASLMIMSSETETTIQLNLT